MNHEHKYFIFQIKSVHEPTTQKGIYKEVEYAWLGCNCGDVIKRRVRPNKEVI